MDLTDQDQLSPKEFDEKRKKERKQHEDSKIQFSRNDMIKFADYACKTSMPNDTALDAYLKIR